MSKNIYERIWLFKGRNTNPAHKDAFNLLISDLRKKNPLWGRKSVDDNGSATRVLFTEENSDGEFWFM